MRLGVGLCYENQALLYVLILNSFIVELKLYLKSQLTGLDALSIVLHEKEVLGQLFVALYLAEQSIGKVLLYFNAFDHGLGGLLDVCLLSEDVSQEQVAVGQVLKSLNTLLLVEWISTGHLHLLKALDPEEQILLSKVVVFHALVS